MNRELEIAIEASLDAGKAIMEIYNSDNYQVENKADNSPLTVADKKANEIINTFLVSTGIPIISEENKQLPYDERKKWNQCWIVDPLDGTREFIKRNGEFTVNISLIKEQRPVLGVIYAPAIEQLYYADVAGKKAFKVSLVNIEKEINVIKSVEEEIKPSVPRNILKFVGSRSHMNEKTHNFIERLKSKYSEDIEIVSKGSSLKFCLVAEGAAHIYPRFAPTMEWDTAAGQAICEAVGVHVISQNSGENMCYNKSNLLNDYFLLSVIDLIPLAF